MTSTREPASMGEALRKMAWEMYRNAIDLYAASKRETVSPYHDTMRAEASAWHDAANDMIVEASRLDALAVEVGGLSAEDQAAIELCVNAACSTPSGQDACHDVRRMIAALHAAGFVVGRVR